MRDGCVVAEIQDYRSTLDTSCPASSALLACNDSILPYGLAMAANDRASAAVPRKVWRKLLTPTGSRRPSRSSRTQRAPFSRSLALTQEQLESLVLDGTVSFLDAEEIAPASPTNRSMSSRDSLATQSSAPHPSKPTTSAPSRSQTMNDDFGGGMDENYDANGRYSSSDEDEPLRVTIERYRGELSSERRHNHPAVRDQRMGFSSMEISTLPATHRFLEKIKGKRRRLGSSSPLSYGNPCWMNRVRVEKFFRAAVLFERQHSTTLQVCLMAMHSDTEAGQLSDVAHVYRSIWDG